MKKSIHNNIVNFWREVMHLAILDSCPTGQRYSACTELASKVADGTANVWEIIRSRDMVDQVEEARAWIASKEFDGVCAILGLCPHATRSEIEFYRLRRSCK